jgi:hypothetical protein
MDAITFNPGLPISQRNKSAHGHFGTTGRVANNNNQKQNSTRERAHRADQTQQSNFFL